jgi:hypothetical protein
MRDIIILLLFFSVTCKAQNFDKNKNFEIKCSTLIFDGEKEHEINSRISSKNGVLQFFLSNGDAARNGNVIQIIKYETWTSISAIYEDDTYKTYDSLALSGSKLNIESVTISKQSQTIYFLSKEKFKKCLSIGFD